MAVIDAKVIQLFVGRCCSPAGSPDVRKIAESLVPTVNAIITKFLGWSPPLATFTEFLPGELTPARKPFGADFGPGMMGGVTTTAGGRFPGASGNQRPCLILKNRPVRSVTSVYANPNAWAGGTAEGDWPAETLQGPETYYLDFDSPGSPGKCMTGKLYRSYGGFWDQVPRSVKIAYQAGLSDAELQNEYADITAAYGLTLSAWLAKVLASQSVGSAANSGAVAGKPVSSVSVKDFAVSFAAGMGTGQFGGGTGGNSGGAGAAIPDEAASLLVGYVAMTKYLNR